MREHALHPSTYLTWTYDDRLSQATYSDSSTNTFQYNGLGLRTQKVDSGGTGNYVCDGASPASTVLADGSAVYSPGSERRSGTSSFRHTDALGSTRGITNAGQTATDAWLHDAFGMTVSRTGTTPTPFSFAGSVQYQSDGDSGLMLLGNRYYDPSIGRFVSSDPVQDGDNWYAYCGNNPLGGVDPEGTAEHRKRARRSTHDRHTGRRSDDDEKGDDKRLKPKEKWNKPTQPKPKPGSGDADPTWRAQQQPFSAVPPIDDNGSPGNWSRGAGGDPGGGPSWSVDPGWIVVGGTILVGGLVIIAVVAAPEVAVPILLAGAV